MAARVERRPCAERRDGGQLSIADGFDPARVGWQLLFAGVGAEVIFNALPLTFEVGGKLVAQVVDIRSRGADWWGLVVPAPAPKSPEEADARFGVEAGVGDAMRRIAEANATVAKMAAVLPKENRYERRRREAQERRAPARR